MSGLGVLPGVAPRVVDTGEVIGGGLFMAFAALGMGLASQYPLGTAMRMGAGYFPLLVSGLLGLLGVLLLWRGLARPQAAQLAPEHEGAAPDQPQPRWRPVLMVGAGVLAFAWLLPSLGLALATVLLTLLSGLARRRARLGELALLGSALGAFSVLVFAYGLGLNLPVLPA
ncbi:tripartite tricarboxylate transporter TctB family protein [Pseudomonas fulva]|nr:tripartite tricarboxylate transporter TctB family protein [Pseudomonas fulva]MBF8780275.1 tripartite tricarboxylate transporter TctB family protein [Pseudomonas fulva]